MGVKTIDLVHYLMGRYGKIIETDLKDNHKIFDRALDTTIPIEKYFERIYDCIKNAEDDNQPYIAA